MERQVQNIGDDHDGDVGFGVYIHWPFCASKCPYCDFNSHVRTRRHRPAALSRRLPRRAARHPATARRAADVGSIFFGGGTPSLMSPATVAGTARRDRRQLAHRRRRRDHARSQSVERRGRRASATTARPASTACRSACSRSTTPTCKALGRLHSVGRGARRHRCRTRSIRALHLRSHLRPAGQTRRRLVRRAARGDRHWPADHLSLYQLTIEPGTPFAALHQRGKLAVPDAERAARALRR